MAVHSTALDITFVPHTPQGSILLSNVSSSIPLTINFVFPRLTLIPLLSNASLYSSKFSLNSSIVSPIRTKSSASRICFIQPFLAFSITSSITIANNKGDNTDPRCTFTENSSESPDPTLTFVSAPS